MPSRTNNEQKGRQNSITYTANETLAKEIDCNRTKLGSGKMLFLQLFFQQKAVLEKSSKYC